jgi:short-subunit dehydrogenase
VSVDGGPRHLVLGGSTGIGYAYAERYARRGHALIIVARDQPHLEAAQATLLASGAGAVETVSCDLADPGARATLLRDIVEKGPFATLFVGGPGPAAGRADEVTDEDHARARDVCINYPRSLLDRAHLLIAAGGRLVLLSSSAADEPLEGHAFYLSAFYRRKISRIIRRATANESGFLVTVLKPRAVITPLSITFAKDLSPNFDAEYVLSEYFNLHEIPTAREYVDLNMDD